MELGLINYIKNMFAMESAPVWSSAYEGVIFYDKTARKWITGNSNGWQELDRKTTVVSGIEPVNWIDPFEYKTNTDISGTYYASSDLPISTDDTTSTYGDYSMKLDTSTTSSGSYIIRNFNPPLSVPSDYISFDVKSDTINSGVVVQFINSNNTSGETNDFDNFNPITPTSGDAYTAKSVIFEFANNWGGTDMNIRSIEFKNKGTLIDAGGTVGITCYATSTYSSLYYPDYAFTVGLSKTGAGNLNNAWNGQSSAATDQRLIVVFDSEQTFDTIVLNNCHHLGGYTTQGVKDAEIYTSSDSVTDTTYGAEITNNELIFSGQFEQHVTSDVEDDKILELMTTVTGDVEVYGAPYNHTINITNLDTYQKQSFFITDPSISGSIDYLKMIVTEPGPIYNIDNMRFDSDQETYWLDVFEYPTTSGLQEAYITSSGTELIASTNENIVSYGNRSMKLAATASASGIAVERAFSPYKTTLTDTLLFDVQSDRLGENLDFSLTYVIEPISEYTAKSIVIDCADQWGGNYMGMRSVEFWYLGSKINITTSDFTAYVTSKFGSDSKYDIPNVFDTTKSKTGSTDYTGWLALTPTNQRAICVFNTSKTFDEIRINNYHNNGTTTNDGVKNAKIYFSTDSITDTSYGSVIASSTLIFDGQFDEHAATNTEDEQTLVVVTSENSVSVITETIDVLALNKFRTYSVDLSDITTISGIAFTVVNDDEATNYYIDSMRFY